MNSKKLNISNLIILLVLTAITITFVVVIISTISNSKVTSYDKYTTTTTAEYDKLGSSSMEEYYVLLYSSEKNNQYNYDTFRNDEIQKTVSDFNKWLKKTKSNAKFYVIDVSKSENSDYLEIFSSQISHEGQIPAIIKMKYNKTNNISQVNEYKRTTSDIINYLENIMKN